MTPSASLMGVPKELRLMIYHELLSTNGTGLHIACCSFHAEIFKWEDDPASRDNQSHTRQTCNTFAQLLRTNREIHSEVAPVLYGATTFHFCIDLYCGQSDSRATGAQLLGFGGDEFSSYPGQEAFMRLDAWVQNVQVAILHLELPPTTEVESYVPGNVRLLLWEGRDNLRAMILSLNKSRNLQNLGLYCTVGRIDEIGELPDVILEYLRPVQHLDSDLKLTIFFANRKYPERLQEIETSHRNFRYIHDLQNPGRQGCVGRPQNLLNEWMKVRIWCIRVFTFFHIELRPTAGDGSQRYEDTNADVVLSAGAALELIWEAHDQGRRTDFEAAKSALHEVWKHNYRLYDNLLQDLPGIEDVSDV